LDRKEKTTGKKDQKTPLPSTEFWPLIKVVKIYTRAPALSTGAVIVDLPGVHDSNAARAAVADHYMKQCTGLWIVAPITRAVDDKAAKKLLGDSFKRQLKYDGNYSSVTFICSKTDDISITEATTSLDLQDQISDLDDQQADYEKEIENLNDKIAELKESIQVYRQVMDEADTEIETWEDLKDDAEDGTTVFAPALKKPSKRKRGTSKRKSSKRRKAEEDDSDVEYISSENDDFDGSETESDSENVQAPISPLTLGEIKQKLEGLKLSKKHARQEKAVVSHQITELKPKIKEIKEKIAGVRAQMSAICIAGRNEYSKGAIQNDFAAGIKELDQENQAEENEEAFNPDEDLRDYDEVARSLPVFCVSSRAYQKMSGRLKKDENVPGFTTPEETGVSLLHRRIEN
jgi:DNA repair exonuclease SbcCD ATPase subunit